MEWVGGSAADSAVCFLCFPFGLPEGNGFSDNNRKSQNVGQQNMKASHAGSSMKLISM
jgi:hypothetical protein